MTKRFKNIAIFSALSLFSHSALAIFSLADDDTESQVLTPSLETAMQTEEEALAAQIASLTPQQQADYEALQAELYLTELSGELNTLRNEIASGINAQGVEIDMAEHLIRHLLLQNQLSTFIAKWRAERLVERG